MANDIVKGLNINKDGYGFVPKLVMRDKEISVKAKAVYSYFCSFTGTGDSCFPTRKTICLDLGISNNSLSKYLKQLTDKGYLTVEQVKEKGRFSHNVYTLIDTISPYTKICDTEKLVDGNLYTKNNSSKNNIIIKNNNSKKERKPTSYDAILSTVSDTSLKELYLEYIKMRKLIKSPLTDRALTMLINKVNDLEPDNVDRQKMLLETAILNNWKSVYPLKDKKPETENTTKYGGTYI